MKTKRRENNCHYYCSIEAAFDVIGGKWKGLVLYHLLDGKKRFNELRRLIPSVTQRIITLQLRELEKDGLIIRSVYPEVPPRVEYSLTECGKALENILHELRDWGKPFMNSEQE